MSVLSSLTAPVAVAAGSVLAEGFDPGVTPNSDAPWYAWLQGFTGSIVGTLILVSVAILAIGVAIALIGRAVSNSTAQKVGIGGVLIGIIGVVILGSISALVFWATGQSIF
ncbi:hypothetical protein [Rothia nasimurium]|uniref:hypothetical protein n=1 Tax=Rothia nasimurium TaxID=85336 RepID=UPI003BA13228